MRRSRGIASVLMGLAGAAMLVAGPIMIAQGVSGQGQIKDELASQKIAFPDDKAKLPPALQEYAGVQVTTGTEAKAFAEYIKGHIAESTDGRTYSEVSAQWIAGGRKDAELAQLRQTAFMGETLRGSMMSAYQAWMVTWLVIGLGALLVGLSAVFGVTAWTLRPQRISVPASPEALESKHLVA
jgi:hypothetical protein